MLLRPVWMSFWNGSTPAPAPPSDTITDSFNRADSAVTLGSTDTGQVWTPRSGTFGINGNQAYCALSAGANNVATVAAAANGTFRITLVEPGGGSAGSADLVVRLSDASNYLFFRFSTINPTLAYKRESGSDTLLATGTALAAAANAVIDIVMLNGSLKLYVDSVLDVDLASTFNQSQVNVGIGTDFGLDGAPRFDAFSFTG